MSEIRTTTSVALVRQPSREPFTCLAEVVAVGMGLAVQASSAAVGLAALGIRSVMDNAKLAQNHSLTMSAVTGIVERTQTAREALNALASNGEIEIPRTEVPRLVTRLQDIVAHNDKAGLGREMRGIIVASQSRLHATMIPMVVEACKAVGYQPERINIISGRVVVCGEGQERGVIDIARDKEGGVKLHFDTDGFNKDECTTKLVEPVLRHLRAQGACMGTQYRRPKRANVYDLERVKSPAVLRRAKR